MKVDARSLRPKKPSCSCAVESPFCKHAVAVLFAILCHCDPGGISETLKNSLSMPAIATPSKVLRIEGGDTEKTAEKPRESKNLQAEEGDEDIPETGKEVSKAKPKKKAAKAKEDVGSTVAPLELVSTETSNGALNPRKRKEPPTDQVGA